ncbi:hypothetical protein VMCG_05794 [Cytospora schulzeri]|uniref:SMP-30/Gluconolactonase/LRE-like region domain-containing protein n=1 Tax=Cytospora schulzeri TaxID=448051 RepID=A0A423WIG3_9PEZI|nr:hypothetical protein VMCG_05794 [Valsa malicola]
MPSLLRTILTTLTAALAVSARPHPTKITSNLTVSVLHDFGYPSWLENLAVRSSGEILTTRMDSPALYQVNHLTGTPVEIATWNGSQWGGCLGIAEGKTDKFYVILAALFDQATFLKTGGVNAVFEVDMGTFHLAADGTTVNRAATVRHVTDIPEADFLNGMATLDDSHVFVSDVYSGTVYLVNVETGKYSLAVDDDLMKWSVAGDPPPTYLGSNGLKVHGGYLYWSNTAAGFLARVKIGSNGLPVGESSVAVTNVAKADDFQFGSDGRVFVAQNQMDTLSVACPLASGNVSVAASAIAGSDVSTVLAGVTSPKFGRTARDSNRLYLSTSGALGLPINGSVTVAGTISYIDIDF